MEQRILNLTQHVATPEQIEAGVFEPSEEDKKQIQRHLTFEDIPSKEMIESRAKEIARISTEIFNKIDYEEEYNHFDYCPIERRAMIGGSPYLMSTLEQALRACGFRVLYAFSKRESVDQTQPDGSVRKVAVFKHCGFVEV